MKLTEVQRLLKDSFEKELTNNRRRHVVFWYDEEGDFVEDIRELELEGVRIWTLTDHNLFATKYELETVDQESNFLIYANMAKPASRNDWLLSIYKMGAEFTTDKVTVTLRELGVMDDSLRFVFKKYARFFNEKNRMASFQSFQIDDYTEEMIDVTVLAALTKSPLNTLDGVTRSLLMHYPDEANALWEGIEKYGDVETFWRLVKRYYGFSLNERSLSTLFIYLLLNSLFECMPGMTYPERWQKYVSSRPTNAVVFMNQWMNHSGDRTTYNKLADNFSEVINVKAYIEEWDIDAMIEADTFRVFDEKIIYFLQGQLISGVNQFDAYKDILMKRRRLHWYPEYINEYKAIKYASLLFQFAHEKDHFLQEQSTFDMFQAYSEDYYQADMFYRKFYESYDRIERQDRLASLREKVEHLYTNWFLQELAVKWTDSLERREDKTWAITGIEQQVDFYNSFVQPHLKAGERVFVVISDALRYEVATELFETLNNERKASTNLRAMQSVIPSYTDLGMATLLPHKMIRYEAQSMFVDGIRASGTKNREKILTRYVEESLAVRFQDLPKRRPELRAMLAGKRLVYIFHNSIDARGDHAATETGVFEAAEEAVNDIRLLVNQLVNNVSASNIIITADHGFLYQRDQLEQRDLMPKDIELALMVKRRFILTDEVPAIDGTLTYSMDQVLDQEMPLHVTVPKGAGRFAIQGAGANYVHGGAMPQEVVVPVITFKNDRSNLSENDVRKVEVKLTSSVRKITNVITYLEFFQMEKVEEKWQPHHLKLYFVDEAGQRISNEISVIADSKSARPSERTYREKFVFRTISYDRRTPYYLIIEEETSAKVYERIPFFIDISSGFGI